MNSMRRMLEVSIGRSKLLEVDVGICRQVSICRRSRDGLRGGNAIGDRQPFGVAPGDLPEFVRRAPEGAEALGVLAQAGFVAGDANRDDVVVTAPGVNTIWMEGSASSRHRVIASSRQSEGPAPRRECQKATTSR